MNPASQRNHTERSDTLLSSGQFRPAAARDSSDPRSSAPTLAVTSSSELARNIDRVQEQVERDSSGSPVSAKLSAGDSRRPEWCVDLGFRLKPMTTFELWIAIANGSVGPETSVWRDGMECWRRVRTIAELAHALPDYSMCSAAANEPTGTPPPTVRERSPSEITPVEQSGIAASHHRTPKQSGMRTLAYPQEEPEPSSSRGTLRTAPYRSAFFSVGIGAAVGAGAVILAVISTHRVQPTAQAASPAATGTIPHAASYAPHARALTARAQQWATGATEDVDLYLSGQEIVFPSPDGTVHRASPSARRRDPGQNRARRGSRP